MHQHVIIALALMAAACTEPKSPMHLDDTDSAATGPSFGTPGGNGGTNNGGGLQPGTTDNDPGDTGTVDTGGPTGTGSTDSGEPVGCNADESLVTVTWTAPDGSSDLTLSGMVEAGYNNFAYTSDMVTGLPVGMVVVDTAAAITARYSLCTPDGARWEWSASFVDGFDLRRYSCEGNVEAIYGTFTVIVDGAPGPTPTAVENGIGGCEHEFVQ